MNYVRNENIRNRNQYENSNGMPRMPLHVPKIHRIQSFLKILRLPQEIPRRSPGVPQAIPAISRLTWMDLS